MASLIQRRGKWYARVSLWDGITQRAKEIPLRTKYREEAFIRLSSIEKVEADIKAGIEFSFPWLSESGITEIVQLTLQDAIDKFLDERKYDGLANSTIIRNKLSLSYFTNVIGKHVIIDSISIDSIARFKKSSKNTFKHSPEGININLRLIKTFLRWCYKKGFSSNIPEVKFIKIPKSPPSYISDANWEKLMKLDMIDDFFKRVFFFYRETGCRLSEPLFASLKGSWLLIPADLTKSKVEKEIQLNDDLKHIWMEIDEYKGNWIRNGRKLSNLTSKFSKLFLSACREININHHFHDIRHTFAVRKYLELNNIYKVRDLMGHSSVKTTESYARFNLMRLKEDFPTILG